MRYGVCIGIDNLDGIRAVSKIGYDYLEFNFCSISRSTDETFENAKKVLSECGIKCEAANCFIPGEFRLTSDSVDGEALAKYIDDGMRKGVELGLKTVVFGSGGAKRIPEGVPYGVAFNRLVAFCRDYAGPIAAKYGVTVVIEPLRKKESNIINTVKEGAMLAAACGCENVADLADIYHLKEMNDGYENIIEVGSLLKHAHISNPLDTGRVYMSDINEYDYHGFIDALEAVGCERCSIEAGLNGEDIAVAAARAYKVIEQL